uniref:Ionotropic glutamate receptor L-glutamate and glycine-binding domain-containing protein n=1 Tax=Daphnia galeata TaxID=27404 RepID=A0A8J2WG77_9CRUS|nr:unnamed protein product [Daphnia galeata]
MQSDSHIQTNDFEVRTLCQMSSLFSLIIALLLVGKTELRHNNKLSGAHFTFVVYHNPPYDVLTFGALGNYSHTGTGPQWQDWLARKLNVTVSYMALNQTTIDENGGSNVELGLRLVANKNADALVNGMIATPERKKMVDFSYFVWTEPYTMVVPRPGEVPRLFALIWPFQPIVTETVI